MPYNSKERKEYYNRNRETLLKKKKIYRIKNRARILKYMKNHDDKIRKRKEKLIGNKCVICDSKKRIMYHEIHGKKHPNTKLYAIEHYKDFIPLCYTHHCILHEFMKYKEKFSKLEF